MGYQLAIDGAASHRSSLAQLPGPGRRRPDGRTEVSTSWLVSTHSGSEHSLGGVGRCGCVRVLAIPSPSQNSQLKNYPQSTNMGHGHTNQRGMDAHGSDH